ncbi:MAG: tetratricopeptide repeat protein [Syntrophales bacterium]|nr:tetratricopeptide repeat protein [Syntrophales bacterium]
MNGKRFIIPLLVLCFILSISGLCYSEDPKNTLTVKRIVFTPDKTGGEWISIFCNQSCIPELFSLEGENPRVVMDMKGVSIIQTKARNINTGGNLIKMVRSYLDKRTNILRVVLDMEPSKNYIVSPIQDPFNNSYMLRIEESEQKPGGSEDAKGSLPSQEKRITILRPDLRPGEQQESKPQEAATRTENRSVVAAAEDAQSVDQGKSQLNAGEFTQAIETYTQILEAHPQDSLSYRLRGNAYDNLGDQQKAVEDWTQAARLGDTIIQSYLDFLGVKWQENPTPSHPKGVVVIGNRDSKRYHLPGMKYYDLVKSYHRVVFQSEEEAIQAGYHRAQE